MVHATKVLWDAMGTDWRAAVAYLERRFPDRWRKRTSTEVSGADGRPIATSTTEYGIDLGKLSDEELEFLEGIVNRAVDA